MGNIKFATESRNGIDGFSIQYNDYPKSYYFGGVENLSSDADEIFFQKEGKYFVYNPNENNIFINGVDVTANGVSAIKTQLESDIFPVNSGGGGSVTIGGTYDTNADAVAALGAGKLYKSSTLVNGSPIILITV